MRVLFISLTSAVSAWVFAAAQVPDVTGATERHRHAREAFGAVDLLLPGAMGLPAGVDCTDEKLLMTQKNNGKPAGVA
jgi:hypothetical protein